MVGIARADYIFLWTSVALLDSSNDAGTLFTYSYFMHMFTLKKITKKSNNENEDYESLLV